MERIPGAGARMHGAAIVVAMLVVALVPIASAQGSAAGGSKHAKVSTKKALKKAGWSSNVDVSFADGTLDYRSDGVPQHGVATHYAVPNPGVVVPDASNSH